VRRSLWRAQPGTAQQPRRPVRIADYIGHWLKVLKADKRAIFTAATQAQRAVDFLHGLQEGADTSAAA
jgi:antirestriction protein ArdC